MTRAQAVTLAVLVVLVAAGCGSNDLFTAVEAGDAEKVEKLLDGSASPDLKGPEGRTPLHVAAEKGDMQMVQLLLDKGAQAFVKDDRGRTPLHLAARADHHQVVRVLSQAQSMQMSPGPPGAGPG
jgi:ankyrin repeat protein